MGLKSANARHLLVESKDLCNELKQRIADGEKFEDLAKEYSQCPSGANGGDLGNFFQGQMVPEFDKVVFSEALNTVHGPIQTEFGYHLLETTRRDD